MAWRRLLPRPTRAGAGTGAGGVAGCVSPDLAWLHLLPRQPRQKLASELNHFVGWPPGSVLCPGLDSEWGLTRCQDIEGEGRVNWSPTAVPFYIWHTVGALSGKLLETI